MPLSPKLVGEPSHALACPAQKRLRIPPCGRLHQRFQILEQGWVVLDSPLAASASAADPPLAAAWYGCRLTTQLPDTRVDRRSRQACRLGHHTDSAASQPHGLRRSPQPTSLLVQDRAQGLDLFGDWQVIVHGLDYNIETLLVKFISRRLLRSFGPGSAEAPRRTFDSSTWMNWLQPAIIAMAVLCLQWASATSL